MLEDGKPVGSIQEVTLARVLHDEQRPAHGAASASHGPAAAAARRQHVHLDEAYRLLLAGNTGVLATQDGKVVDIVTRIDLIQYWNRAKEQK